jgi:predicted enzyme related to lactoylglutathione lyase
VFLVADIASTMAWYRATLGFAGYTFPESPPYSFCILSKDDVQIFLQQLEGYRKPDVYEQREGGVWNAYLQVRGVRHLYQAVSELTDITVLEPICHQEYGQTEFVIRDPNGYVLVLAERDGQ